LKAKFLEYKHIFFFSPYQVKEKEVTTLTRYKRELETTTKKLQEELSEKDKTLDARETVGKQWELKPS
jgi:hypothetical protein